MKYSGVQMRRDACRAWAVDRELERGLSYMISRRYTQRF
ncbi:Uncharacterised protein [Mycobacteroides abscessus subsp. massiliense]|nr:Uncharacterised protein [Mycobacteroides abscessus subsp. massiliense]